MLRIKILLRITCFLFFYLLLGNFTMAQQEAWVARYNGPVDRFDEPTAMAVDSFGNIYVTGWSWGEEYTVDYATVKYDKDGKMLWVSRYDNNLLPNESGCDRANNVTVDNLGNVYVTGYSWGGWWDTKDDYATIKYDKNGNELWVARFNGPNNGDDMAKAIKVDGLGNIYVTGISSNRFFSEINYATVKYDKDGNQVWLVIYNGPGNGNDYATDILIDSSNNVYVMGDSVGNGTSADYTTIKYDSNGNEIWEQRYNGPGNGDDIATAIDIDDLGNIYVTGKSWGGWDTKFDYETVKYDNNGNELWKVRYNGPSNDFDNTTDLAVDALGNVYVTGRSEGNYTTIKYDNNGKQLWIRDYNGPKNSDDGATAIAIDSLGNVYVTGVSHNEGIDYDFATIKYDKDGNELWVSRYNGSGNEGDSAIAIAIDNSDNVFVTGASYGIETSYDYATIKYIPLLDIELIPKGPTKVNSGEIVPYNMTLTNNAHEVITVDAKTWIKFPNDEMIDPLDGPKTYTLNPGDIVSRDMERKVPIEWEPGDYILHATVQDNEGKILDDDYIIYTLTKDSNLKNKME